MEVVVQKLKWDPDGLETDEDFEEMDDDDRGAFEKMRQVSDAESLTRP